ncbi:hypothetical protein, partial [Rahnella bruchi]
MMFGMATARAEDNMSKDAMKKD